MSLTRRLPARVTTHAAWEAPMNARQATTFSGKIAVNYCAIIWTLTVSHEHYIKLIFLLYFLLKRLNIFCELFGEINTAEFIVLSLSVSHSFHFRWIYSNNDIKIYPNWCKHSFELKINYYKYLSQYHAQHACMILKYQGKLTMRPINNHHKLFNDKFIIMN